MPTLLVAIEEASRSLQSLMFCSEVRVFGTSSRSKCVQTRRNTEVTARDHGRGIGKLAGIARTVNRIPPSSGLLARFCCVIRQTLILSSSLTCNHEAPRLHHGIDFGRK